MKQRYLARGPSLRPSRVARLNMLFDKMILELAQAESGFERGDLKAVNDGTLPGPGHPPGPAWHLADRRLEWGE